MIKTLQPAYNLLPTRQILSGTLLQAELARVNLRIYNELAKETNCTIALWDHTAELSLKIIHQFSIYGALRAALI
ncbi:unnamed protein product [Rhizophagus irregularis]|uniref:Uncharacterized protein n=1 Tax=Rhizophagus irregularis (strain DAOM 181602 / DAOM 197198 / MUCL 43194) TaxID=747089 RepID=U9SJ51_RHIID|nr:unnamed protein product [Rhizophagus irregularis]